MTSSIRRPASFIKPRVILYVVLFAYFGFMAMPQWFRPLSPQFMVWLMLLPIILLALVIAGVWGGIGLLRTRKGRLPVNAGHMLCVQLALTGLVWFGLAGILAYGTHYLYNHQKFDVKVWQDPQSNRFVYYELTARQKMLDDVVGNVLPGGTKNEIEALLGLPDEVRPSADGDQNLYILGPERGMGVDFECLLVRFDRAGQYQGYEDFGNCG